MGRVNELLGRMRRPKLTWKLARASMVALAAVVSVVAAAAISASRYELAATEQSAREASARLDAGEAPSPRANAAAELVPCGPNESCMTTALSCTSLSTGVGAGTCSEAIALETGGCASFALEGTAQHWFKFTVPEGGPWRYNFATLGSGDTSCRVYSACGALPMAGYSENLSTRDFNCRAASAGGFVGEPGQTYYVRVSGAGLYQPNLWSSGPSAGGRSAPAAMRESFLRVLASAIAFEDTGGDAR